MDIQDAYRLLAPTLGAKAASVVFALALLASGQNSTITGTLAGQVRARMLRPPCAGLRGSCVRGCMRVHETCGSSHPCGGLQPGGPPLV